MNDQRVLLDAASFLGSAEAARIGGAATAEIRTVAQNFLACCYDGVGKAPRLLDGEDLARILREWLPRHFGVRDPLAACVPEVLGAYLEHLASEQVVPAIYELRRALDEHAGAFAEAVREGRAHRDGIAVTGPGTTVRHRAAKTGRNDPCPCGSGRKFKKCCLKPGR